MNYVTLFPEAENIHLIKDVGMIPFVMGKYYNLTGKVACYNNGPYEYLDKDVKGLSLDIIKKYTSIPFIDGCIYIITNAKKIDILQVFHSTERSLLWVYLYKLINKSGKAYLKLDADESIKSNVFKRNFKSFIKRILFNKCDLISVETTKLLKLLNNKWPVKVRYIPNGFYDYDEKKEISFKQKKNTICTVGRIGTNQKATEILLEAYRLAYDKISNWQLRIVGPIDKQFEGYIEVFLNNNPTLRNSIVFTGPIYDRMELQHEYEQAKIFCLTSRYESFGIVLVEALKAGCFVITSEVLSASDITNNRKLGDIFSFDDYRQLADSLKKYCNDEQYLEKLCNKIQEYGYENFDWIKICKSIKMYLEI